MQTQKAGDIFISDIKNNAKMVHAKLKFTAENSGKLVAKVKQEAKMLALKDDKEYIITDGSPGIGCPVISSLSGANLVLLVTEATLSGLHDLKRVYELAHKFNYHTACIINKADLNEKITQQIKDFLVDEDISLICELPYDETFTKSLAKAMPIVEFDKNSKLSQLIVKSWEDIKQMIKDKRL